MNETASYYARNAKTLRDQYNSVSFDAVHADWLQLLPTSGRALDIGAGSGRDALALAERGFFVTAIEPVAEMREQGLLLTERAGVEWLNDSLPKLSSLNGQEKGFNLILLSAVWMHLDSQERMVSIGKLATLLEPNGVLVVTLRHGEFSDGRISVPSSVDEIKKLASSNNLSVILATQAGNDELGRKDVVWQTIVIKK